MIGEMQQTVAESPGVVAFLEYAGVAAAIGGTLVIGAAETVGSVLKLWMQSLRENKAIKPTLALIFGPAFLVAANGAGFLAAPIPGAWSWALAFLAGIGSGGTAVIGHKVGLSKVIDGIKSALSGKQPPAPPAGNLPK